MLAVLLPVAPPEMKICVVLAAVCRNSAEIVYCCPGMHSTCQPGPCWPPAATTAYRSDWVPLNGFRVETAGATPPTAISHDGADRAVYVSNVGSKPLAVLSMLTAEPTGTGGHIAWWTNCRSGISRFPAELYGDDVFAGFSSSSASSRVASASPAWLVSVSYWR